MGDNLLTTLITSLTKEIKAGIPEDNKEAHKVAETILSGVKLIGKMTMLAANEQLKSKTGMDFYSFAQEAGFSLEGKDKKDGDKDAKDLSSQTIKELKELFQKCVNARLGIGKNDDDKADKRLIIYIDDLDRLAPDKAVEVLEILKIFLDCENCVFLLAIDYSVVVNGVAIKYKGTLSEDKGRDFFEKMIQVVYTMPKSLVHTDRYIASMLCTNGINKAVAVDFAKLVKAADKDNPRAIKRLINSYSLLDKMHRHMSGSALESRVALFAMLCLQNTCESLYDYLLQRRGHLSADFFNNLQREVIEEPEEFAVSKAELLRLELIDREGTRNFKKYAFLKVFFEQIIECIPGENLGEFDYMAALTEEHLEIISHALETAEITGLEKMSVTEDDCVALILFDFELFETETGTVKEAYVSTFERLLSYSDADEIKAVERDFADIVSLDQGKFSSCVEIKCKKGVEVYLNTNIYANEMAVYSEKIAKYFEFSITWFKDKAGRQVLLEYDSGNEPPESFAFENFEDSDWN